MNMTKIFKYLVLIFLLLSNNLRADNNAIYTHKADSILQLMTLEEKIGQLNMVAGLWGATGPESSTVDKMADIKAGGVGSMLNVSGLKRIREMQSLALQSRLKIPLIFGLDVIHGYKTVFPIPLAQAASFDTAQIRICSQIAAKESMAAGLNWTFSPMLDVSRDPRWGRVMECPGEDPFLACAIAKSSVEGYQKPQNGLNFMACAKHFAAYSAAIGGRDYNTVDISDQTLYDIYLPPFKAAVKAGISSFMCSFNEINGVPASGNPKLYSILYNDWKFNGIVVSDWGSIAEMVTHGYSKDREMAAKQAITVGVDIDMQSFCYKNYFKSLVVNKELDEEFINKAVRKVLIQKFQLGLFDNPYRYCNDEREKNDMLTAENRQQSRSMAQKSIVLLKNTDRLLPLQAVRKICIVGPLGNSPRDMDGNWTIFGNSVAVTLLNAVKNKFPEASVVFEKGCEIKGEDKKGFEAAVNAAKEADVVLLALGESWNMSGEARSRGSLSLPGVQEELALEIYKANPKTVTLLMGGRPLVFNKIVEKAPAILYCWWLGSEAGNAMVDVLWGKYNPSARLTMSFPKDVGQIPVFYNRKNSGRPATEKEGNYSGRYIDMDYKPQYHFGFGLSYTTFNYDKIEVQQQNQQIQVTMNITNTGDKDGTELVQVYTHRHWGEVTAPIKELKGFLQVFLKKGETKTISINIPYAELEYYGLSGWCKPTGDYDVMVGKNSNETYFNKTLTLE